MPISGLIELTPEPRSLEALGRNHTLEAALAELVDNSVDAGALHVLIRFVRRGGRLIRLIVADDGRGMDDARIDVAMTVGGDRTYSGGEIGRFGLGLKAASFSQARSVTVVSAARGATVTGRRWQVEHAKSSYQCEIVETEFARELVGQDWGFPHSDTGTVVRWDEVEGFPSVDDESTIDRFLHGTIARLRTHLGLIFHRILDSGKVRVAIDVEDQGGVLSDSEVPSLDPFAYPRSGASGWPKCLVANGDQASLSLDCHVWPGRSSLDQFRLDGDLIQRQGIYAYYNDRLVQAGGWNGLCHADKQLNLARVALDIEGDVAQMVSLKPEKNGIEPGPDFNRAVYAAQTSDGLSFKDYVDRARGVLKDSNRRRRERPAIMPPGAGFSPRVRRAFSRELAFKNEDPIEVRWEYLQEDDFFEIDRERGVLWLNKRYRRALTGSTRGDNIEMWQAILTAAAEEELR